MDGEKVRAVFLIPIALFCFLLLQLLCNRVVSLMQADDDDDDTIISCCVAFWQPN